MTLLRVVVAVAVTLTVALILSYSRSGVLAAGGGVWAIIVALTAPRRRLSVGAGLIVAAGLSGWLLYPTFARDRNTADFAYALALDRQTDASGWTPRANRPDRPRPVADEQSPGGGS